MHDLLAELSLNLLRQFDEDTVQAVIEKLLVAQAEGRVIDDPLRYARVAARNMGRNARRSAARRRTNPYADAGERVATRPDQLERAIARQELRRRPGPAARAAGLVAPS